mgnify:CR=1 FL=1
MRAEEAGRETRMIDAHYGNHETRLCRLNRRIAKLEEAIDKASGDAQRRLIRQQCRLIRDRRALLDRLIDTVRRT